MTRQRLADRRAPVQRWLRAQKPLRPPAIMGIAA